MFARVFRIAIALIIVVSFATRQEKLATAQAPERGGQDRGGRGDATRGARGGGLANKIPELPAGAFTASSTVAHTTLQHEWVDIPLGGARLRAWIEYPAGNGKAPVVVVMSHEAGLDDWMRAVADAWPRLIAFSNKYLK